MSWDNLYGGTKYPKGVQHILVYMEWGCHKSGGAKYPVTPAFPFSRHPQSFMTPGRFRSPHANVLGRLVPNGLPKGNKADTRPWVDLTNEAQHVETHARSERGACGRGERGRPSGLSLHCKNDFNPFLVTPELHRTGDLQLR